jgi:hypothetical protein
MPLEGLEWVREKTQLRLPSRSEFYKKQLIAP